MAKPAVRTVKTLNLYEAKTRLSRLVEDAAKGEEIVIAKAGVPRARLVGLAPKKRARRPGGAKGALDRRGFDAPFRRISLPPLWASTSGEPAPRYARRDLVGAEQPHASNRCAPGHRIGRSRPRQRGFSLGTAIKIGLGRLRLKDPFWCLSSEADSTSFRSPSTTPSAWARSPSTTPIRSIGCLSHSRLSRA